jgi:iron only hydrogenase large subunit-like protein
MSATSDFHHALYVDPDQCNGCVHCLRVCPTEAIRVKGGCAVIDPDRCVDCGNCFRVCPVRAIKVEQDDLTSIKKYPVRIALIPAVFIGRFPSDIKTETIYGALLKIGFNHVFEVEHGVGVVAEGIRTCLSENPGSRPLISSYCPAVIRFIQVRYPALTDHIIRIKTPHDMAAIFCRKYFGDQGYTYDETGVFYVTPCAAKIAAFKSPVGERKSVLSGVINMDFLYNRVLSAIYQERGKIPAPEYRNPSASAIKWSLARGEVSCSTVRALAIDGIHEISDFLDKLEDGQIRGIDFLEMKACQEGCPGGILTAGNTFLTVENMERRAASLAHSCSCRVSPLHEEQEFLSGQLSLEPVEPRSGLKLDQEVETAMAKLESLKKIELLLPGIDCGACGAPTCHALAEDIVLGKGYISQCPFMDLLAMKRGQITPATALDHAEEVWKGRIKE